MDLDPQAIEITMMNLYLKALENERDLPQKQHLLPELGRNIRCGNSLIAPDIADEQELSEEELKRLKPFDWYSQTDGFGDILKEGGVHAIIGNPPYFNVDTLGKKSPQMVYLKKHYDDVWNDKTDILNYFLYLGLTLSRARLGMIVSRAFLEAYKSNRLREAILRHSHIQNVVDFSNFYVFEAGITTSIIILDKTPKKKGVALVWRLGSDNANKDAVAHALSSGDPGSVFESIRVKQSTLTGDSWNFVSPALHAVHRRIDDEHPKLGDVLLIGQGMQTGRNDVFGGLTNKDVKKLRLGKQWVRKRAANSDIRRYLLRDRAEFLVWVEDARNFKDLPRSLQCYLKAHAKKLRSRAAFKRGNCEWWKFTWPLHKHLYGQARIISPFLSPRNRFALDKTKRFIGLTDRIAIFRKPETPESISYFLGLLNSRALDFRFKGIAKLKSAGIYEYFWNSVSKLPIPRIDFAKSNERRIHDEIVKLAEQIQRQKSKLEIASNKIERQALETSVQNTDQEIDELVYQLYGLMPEEIALIEKSFQNERTTNKRQNQE